MRFTIPCLPAGRQDLKYRNNGRRGVIILPTVLMFGGLITAIAVVGLLIITIVNTSNSSVRYRVSATAAAKAGVQDAVLRIIRDSSFVSSSYSVTVGASGGGATATVSVSDCTTVACLADPTVLQKDVVSVGNSLNRNYKLQARVHVNKTTGIVQIFYVDIVGI